MKSGHLKKSSKPQSNDSSQLPPHFDQIQNQVQKRLVNPQESTYCNCDICMTNYEIKQRGKAFLRQTSSNMKIQPTKMQQFLNLISAVNTKIYCKLDIPQICFFYKGDPRKLYKSNNSGVHQIELNHAVRKNLASVFVENRRVTYIQNNSKSDENSLNYFTGQRDTHIKNFSTVIPSFRHGQKIQLNKPQTYIFHNDRNYQEDPDIMMSQSQSEQICILKSKDKGLELINEKQLRQILKSLLSLQNVQYIQTYVKPNEKEDQIFQATYSIGKGPENQLMFNRSLTQVKIQINLMNKFSKDYIPMEHLESYESLLKEIPQEYCLYQTYKMIHYMELTKDVTIEKIGTLWLRNQAQELCFFGLADFQWYQNQKLSVDVGQIEQLKQIMNSQLTDFEQELLNAWENMKHRKLKPEEKPYIDEEKQQKIQQIKKQSTIRLAKQREKEKSKRKQKSGMEKSLVGSSDRSHY